MRTSLTFILILSLFISQSALGQRKRNTQSTASTSNSLMKESTFKGLKLRNIGPAFMSGRIADLAIHPDDESIWYVAVGSGGVWKTVNAGVTWTPIFDYEESYSIGCVALDPNNPHTVWVGTGENVGGRHVGYGDGIYKSEDGGKSWQNLGLKASEHISKIIVHPDNSDVVYVAVQGPLWTPGGERGFYKTTDGGKTWKKTLGDDQWTGVTDMVVDPRNANRIYAASWEHNRTVAAYMGGGPNTGIYKSEDAGETWTELKNGIPGGNKGKIGLAISFQEPDHIYAAIELNRKKGGVYKSYDRGMSWKKQSDAVSGGTGPHYYQELFASPHHYDRLYLMDASMQYSVDGGKTFNRINRESRHGDNHAMAFKKNDPDYIMVGTDGGVYESFDLADNWRYIENLPLTQYYKVALDDAEPFYNIYGGTQDNNTQGGPSRTDNRQGIQNSDWRVILGADGHQPATEPGNPDIVYAETQQGGLHRVDMTTGEVVNVQPQPGEGEDYERFNWDAPILVSPHKPTRLYFGSQRLWKSENRGDSWTAISPDLTRNQERITLPIMGKQQSWDSPWDVGAMSNYNTITSVSESPVQEGVIYIGTDDGIIQVTEDGGNNWRKIEAGSLPGVPSTAFINDIKADLHDANTVYVVMDNHKYGDFSPYIYKSTNRGASWTSVKGNLPDRTLLWRVVQDHIKPSLMFCATEFGIYFTVDGGVKWTELQGGVPQISFRDLAIQKRENDLVAASFGRGFFILDDYSPLREVSESTLQQEGAIFASRKAWWYVPRSHLGFRPGRGSQGAQHYLAPNPDFGAVFTYHLKDGYKTLAQERKEKEKKMKDQNIPFPGWDELEKEAQQVKPKVWIVVKDSEGNTVRRVEGKTKKGIHRVAWDLRYPSPNPVNMEGRSGGQGLMAAPGKYTATLYKEIEGTMTQLDDPIEFDVVPMRKGALDSPEPEVVAQFWRTFESTSKEARTASMTLNNSSKKARAMEVALEKSIATPGEFDSRLYNITMQLKELDSRMFGNAAKRQIGERSAPTIFSRLGSVGRGLGNNTYGPTETNKQQLVIINKDLASLQSDLSKVQKDLDKLGKDMMDAGAPWVESITAPENE